MELTTQSVLERVGSPHELPEIVRDRAAVDYNEVERGFSSYVQRKLCRLLRGDDNHLLLMKRDCKLGGCSYFLVPNGMESSGMRQQVAEEIIAGVLRFLDPFGQGGPVAQRVEGSSLIEVQVFPTQHPHIIVERTDAFTMHTRERLSTEWRALRLQNQRKSTLVNRAVDLGILALEITSR